MLDRLPDLCCLQGLYTCSGKILHCPESVVGNVVPQPDLEGIVHVSVNPGVFYKCCDYKICISLIKTPNGNQKLKLTLCAQTLYHQRISLD